MTDERMGDSLWAALRRLPPRAGVVFRHYATPPAERRALLRRVRRIAAARRLRLVVGYVPGGHGRGPRAASWPAHDRRQAVAGVAAGAARFFVSPVYATRSHPGVAPLGPMKAARVARGLGEVVALGGMDTRRFRRIARLGFDGWAGVGAWVRPDRLSPRSAPSGRPLGTEADGAIMSWLSATDPQPHQEAG